MGSGLLSPTHLAVVLAVVLIVFGPKRLPELGKALGNGMRSFKHALDGGEDEDAVPLAPPAAETAPAPVTPVHVDEAAADSPPPVEPPLAHARADETVGASPPGDQSPAA